MNFYSNELSERVIFNNKKTLKDEYRAIEKLNEKDEGDSKNPFNNSNKSFLQHFYGKLYTEEVPYIISESSLIKESPYTITEFNNLSVEQQGMVLAIEAVKNKIETVKEYHRKKESFNGK